ncbi:UDP-N-acetylglucosamine 2-epimerase (non-hydrolyzing) [Aureibaculum sp. 2210JD6-5]|uniref:non-hydrolyzing UDP-N-acetylglucosamine 2-epimerase n=1 Tax=Aureibaculum sp. 2210JD6-5 TaxID=3103957 RepID=UPI002AAE285C|nr:UDP-N-acetylglucosamine 2-epimerase (non-hydrolyzing) [Aureibaculum sp. 2210JD6-5]MDY7396593.1 UDP-N-acetylglucosamine 2-epimerase (non-hydrolyzing) [Aureibaculum sp. 2210JD6-5]
MKKIITILGARPQFVKAAVLSRVITSHQEIEEIIVHTGQHFDTNMSAVFFEEMDIPMPKYNLDINGLGHGAMTGQMLEKIEKVLLDEKPSLIVVYGDTNSTIAGALAAKKLGIKVVHIEAGLRSFNMNMPEEINRILTDRISDLLLCPTQTAVDNLNKEGFSNLNIRIVNSGDIMKDAVEFYGKKLEETSNIINRLSLQEDDFVLATIHRQENTDNIEKLKSIFEGLEKINKHKKVVLPLHPRTKNILKKYNLSYNITTIDPVGYFDMLALLKNCQMVITDSGGLQKEAYFNKKHCIIAREETEWTELVENGFAQIVGSNTQKIIAVYEEFSSKKSDFSKNLYGENVGETMYIEILKIVQS